MEAADVLPCSCTVRMTFFHVQTQVFGGGVDDAFIGLVRHEPVDLIGGITCLADDFVGDFCEHF